MDVVFALDWDSEARQTFELNFPAATFEPTDIRDTSEDIVYELVAKQRPNPILFCGCAPCQPFTKHNTIRPERDEDDRVPLLLDFLRFIQRCEPDIVFVENVPGIQNVSPDSEPLSQFLERPGGGWLYRADIRFGAPDAVRSPARPPQIPPARQSPRAPRTSSRNPRPGDGQPRLRYGARLDRRPSEDRGRRYAPHDPRPPSCRPFGAQPEAYPRNSGGRRQPGLAGRTPAEMPRRRHRIQRCLRPHVVGPSRFRADYPMHQLLQRSLRAPRAGSCDQRPGSGLPSDIPDGLPVRRESQFHCPADRQRRAGETGRRLSDATSPSTWPRQA